MTFRSSLSTLSFWIVILDREHEPELQAYLDGSPDDTIWLRSIWAEGNASFAAYRREGRIAGLAALDARGVVHVHGGGARPEVLRACVRSARTVAAVAGPPGQVEEARSALGMDKRRLRRTLSELIMGLHLGGLVVPPLLASKKVLCREARDGDRAMVDEWHRRYLAEVHGSNDLPEEVLRHGERGQHYVLEDDGVIVNTVSLSAVFPRLAQLEYAYSPPELRNRSYGRSAAAGALLAARGLGVERAVLYTAEHNLATQAAVYHLGFRRTGRHRVLVF